MSNSGLDWVRRGLAMVMLGVVGFGGCSGSAFTQGNGPLPSDGGQSDGGMGAGECTPTKSCGDGPDDIECGTARDGCGSTLHCGGCASGKTCKAGRCVAQDYCGDAFCGADETCESCPDDCTCGSGGCIAGACCIPDCGGKACGEDGCGGLCPPGCKSGFVCQQGACQEAASCGNGTCEAARGENCGSCPLDCTCAGSCLSSACCEPNCDGKECGGDGCGGSCGKCADFSSCAAGACVADVVCGRNGCQSGENCQNCANDCGCAPGKSCTDTGACCTPDCAGRQCGSDGCGGQCTPGCGPGKSCNGAGQCVVATSCGDGICQAGSESCSNCPSDCACTPGQVCVTLSFGVTYTCCTKQCSGKTCGPDGCNGTCGPGCSANQACSDGKCVDLTTSIKVQGYSLLPASSDQIQPRFQIVNTGSAKVAISSVTVRYWFTFEGSASGVPQFSCDFAAIDCQSVAAKSVKVSPARPGADYYVELSFSSGLIMDPGANSGEIDARINHSSFAAVDQTNDYSFDPVHMTFVDAMKITAYIGGSLVWGEEP